MRPLDEDDATVVMRPAAAPPPPPSPPRRRALPIAAAALVVAALGGGLGWLLWPPRPAPTPPPKTAAIAQPPAPPLPAPAPAPLPPAAPPPAPSPAFAIVTADEAAIAADMPTGLSVFRFAAAPAVVVLDFADLAEQGAMLNRVAALVEKAGLPRDRVLTDAELDAAIRAAGDTPATFYYGHDYSAAELVHFFALADAGHVPLDPAEERLRILLRQLDWSTPPGAPAGALIGALISIPRAGTEIDAAARAAMLHHELSHGVFFTDSAYAAYVRGFWAERLTAAERAAMTHFLGSEDYDTADTTLMVNEMQAYLMFTDDARFFQPANIGMIAARRAALRAAFAQGAPPGWPRTALLRDMVKAP